MNGAEFDAFLLENMPYFIAINYKRLLETQKPQEQVTLILHIYNLGLRALTINLIAQYFFRDWDRVRDPDLDKLLKRKFPHLTADAWEEILFAILGTYKNNRALFFMPELYDFYWDTSVYPHKERAQVKAPFKHLTKATQDLLLERQPQDQLGWEALAQGLHEHLRKILQGLSFIGQYELIRILAQDKHSYTFELHKGIQILTSQRPLPQHTRLTNRRFYLRADTEEFLSLHPLLVFWEDTIEQTNMGVFDRWIELRLKYLLATPDETRLDDKYLKDFVYLILDAIEEAWRERQKANQLTWKDLRDICRRITNERTATVQGKYHQSLYLQRNAVHKHIMAFLADAQKHGFVLVGKSGVGKSNFLLALAEELQQVREDVCVLMYDGANLPVASSSLTDIINKDFSNQVILDRQAVQQQVWQEIAKIDNINERQVVLCVDAINENRDDPTKLLSQLDDLVQKSSWPWLKIVLSSRPETWKEIKRGVKLAEVFYYREPSGETLGVELEPFSYSERMDPFTPQELPEVYSKYEQEFNLKTPYQTLSHQVREALRDPLQLQLLAKTYKGQAIPEHVTVSTLIEQYVHAILQREERRFLEQQLIPLMVKEGHYSNAITEAELDAAGGALYEMIYSDQMNQMFRALSDADILVLQEQGREQKIAFKYERFYEYFAGKRIASLSETQVDRYAFFLELIEEITGKKEATGKPFLWGAVRNALVEEARKPNSETILKLCRTTEQRVKEMMVNVLITLGLDDPKPVEELLKHLLPQEKKVGEVQKLRQLVRKSAEQTDLRTRNARKIAIEVASMLKQGWVLQSAALQMDSTMRAVATRYSYYLWQRDQVTGFVVLKYIAEKATAGLIPNVAAIDSVVGLSAVILCEHYQDEGVLNELRDIWRAMLADLFRIQEGSGPWKRIVGDFIRERLTGLAITLLFGLFRQLPNDMLSYQALEAFFRLGIAEKALYRRLVHYFDVNGNYSKEQMEQDYLAVLKIDNVLVSLTTLMSLASHACSAPLIFLPFLKRLFEEAKKDVTTYPYLMVIANVMMEVLYRDPTIDEAFDFFVYTAETCQEHYTKHPETYHSRIAKAPQVATLGPYILFQYQRAGMARTVWLEERINTAISQNNLIFFDLLFTEELPQVIELDQQKPKAALEVLEIFFQKSLKAPLQKDGQSILEFIIAFLARLRIRYPDEVDDFLEAQKAPDDFRLQVRTNEPAEKVGDLIGKRAWFFIRDNILLGSPELQSQLQDFLAKSADSKNMRSWIDYGIRKIINATYGSQVLRQSK
jgi:NACHT domain